MVEVPASVLERYRYWSLYNSPYDAHDHGRAIDLYPDPGTAPSPVDGKVLDLRTVRAPPKPYAAEHDYLIVIDTGTGDGPTYRTAEGDPAVARVLHVDPSVEVGDRVCIGDDLGTPVRAGFFAPWVENHLHLGFRSPDANPYRASGSLRIDPGVDPVGLDWDGTGTVVETGDTYALLDAPEHPDPGGTVVGIAADGGGVLDGGLPHYDGGGLLGVGGHETEGFDTEPHQSADAPETQGSGTPSHQPADAPETEGSGTPSHQPADAPETGGSTPNNDRTSGEPETEGVSDASTVPNEARSVPVDVLGTTVGYRTGRTIDWADVTVLVDGDPITGLSLFVSREHGFGAKLICPDRSIPEGDTVTVSIRRSADDPNDQTP